MLTLQFIPEYELNGLSAEAKVNKVLGWVRKDRILVIQGKLDSEEEALLIQKTMESISKDFKGVEICSADYNLKEKTVQQKIKENIASWLTGNRVGFSIIGPASIVREIKKNPHQIELLFSNTSRKKRK
jgi:hypothetical protein